MQEDQLTCVGSSPEALADSLAARYDLHQSIDRLAWETGLYRTTLRRLIEQHGAVAPTQHTVSPARIDQASDPDLVSAADSVVQRYATYESFRSAMWQSATLRGFVVSFTRCDAADCPIDGPCHITVTGNGIDQVTMSASELDNLLIRSATLKAGRFRRTTDVCWRAMPPSGPERDRLARQVAAGFDRGHPRPIGELATEVRLRPTTVRRLLEQAGVREDQLTCVGSPPEILAASLAARYRVHPFLEPLVHATGLDRRAVRRLLDQSGVARRARRSMPAELADQTAQRYRSGATVKQLAEWTGCTGSTVRRHLIRAGVQLRLGPPPA
ncbi:MAG TPA: hypothetical protein VFX16_12625 [Pseudonocardiaceae bacterium]|nr:hypothetical protein [Pseudonocardiaceae bacterium]